MVTVKEIEAIIDNALEPIAKDIAEIRKDIAIIREHLAKAAEPVTFTIAGSKLLGVLSNGRTGDKD